MGRCWTGCPQCGMRKLHWPHPPLNIMLSFAQEENEAEEEVLDGVSTVLSSALRKWGDAAMPFIEPLMPTIGQVLRCACLSRPSETVCLHPNVNAYDPCLRMSGVVWAAGSGCKRTDLARLYLG